MATIIFTLPLGEYCSIIYLQFKIKMMWQQLTWYDYNLTSVDWKYSISKNLQSCNSSSDCCRFPSRLWIRSCSLSSHKLHATASGRDKNCNNLSSVNILVDLVAQRVLRAVGASSYMFVKAPWDEDWSIGWSDLKPVYSLSSCSA